MSGALHPWAAQVNAALAECARRLAALEARVERLDAHSGELARELLDVIGRVDASQERGGELEARLEALDASFVRHQGQNEDDLRRAEQTVDRVGQDLSRHEDAHWRSGR
jgi:chromosome segregation ATPase